MKQSRNLAIDWLKGWMIIFVVLHHTFLLSNFRGHLAVDVFFFISGYFLMKSFDTSPESNIQYIWRRIKIMFPPYCLCLGVMFVWKLVSHRIPASLEEFGELFFAVPFLEEFGGDFSRAYYLWGSWFLSVLIIGSFLVYGMLQYNRKLSISILFPVLILLGYNALFSQSESVEVWGHLGYLGGPLIRGTIEIMAGTMLYHLYTNYKSGVDKYSCLINLVGIIAFVFLVFLIFSAKPLDKFIIVVIPWILLAAVIEKSWLNSFLNRIKGGIISIIGRYTFYIYCAHGIAIMLLFWLNEHFLNKSLANVYLMLCILGSTVIFSLGLYYACRLIKRASQRCNGR